MKSMLVPFIVMALLISTLTFPALAASKPPEKGEGLPVINLPVPKDPEERNYLGLSGSGFFKIPQIKAKAVIIEFFSMYCPICQKDAPGVNELYRLIEKNPDIKNKVKLIGIGAGNSPYEVGVYKKTYDVPFPLFPDKDFAIHEAFGNVRTPYFIAIRIKDDRTHDVFYSEAGGFGEPGAFLESIMAVLGPKP